MAPTRPLLGAENAGPGRDGGTAETERAIERASDKREDMGRRGAKGRREPKTEGAPLVILARCEIEFLLGLLGAGAGAVAGAGETDRNETRRRREEGRQCRVSRGPTVLLSGTGYQLVLK